MDYRLFNWEQCRLQIANVLYDITHFWLDNYDISTHHQLMIDCQR